MAGTRTHYTVKEARAILAPHHINIRYMEGEYRVSFVGEANAEASAYYTNDIVDAIDTGLAMAARRGPVYQYDLHVQLWRFLIGAEDRRREQED